MPASFTASVTVAGSPPPVTGSWASLTLGGVTYLFEPEHGEELDPYRDPRGEFVQRSVLCVSAMPHFRAYYRPDTEGGREEWVFELGDYREPAPQDLPAYTVVITRADGTTATIAVPYHYWHSRWRWQSAPRPVRRTPAQIYADKLLPPYDPEGLDNFTYDKNPQTYTIMGFAGLLPWMGSTGERPDIGVVTGWQGDYLCAGTLLSTVLAQGEAGGTLNFHIRDLDTGAPLDIFQYPNANLYSASVGTPFIAKVLPAAMGFDTGHQPTQSYLPFLLTGDVYYLEDVQFQSNMCKLVKPPNARWTDQGRYFAWPLRDTLYAALATPAVVPSWLKPRAYFEHDLAQYRARFDYYMASSDSPFAGLNIVSGSSKNAPDMPGGTVSHPWEDDMMLAMLGIAVWCGFEGWRAPLEWKVASTLARTDGSCWPRSHCTTYDLCYTFACTLTAEQTDSDQSITVNDYGLGPWPAAPFDVVIDSETETVTDTSEHPVWSVTRGATPKVHKSGAHVYGPDIVNWQDATARNYYVQPAKMTHPPGDPGGQTLLAPDQSVPYVSYTRAALGLCAALNVPDTEEPSIWVDSECRRMSSATWIIDRKWCITPPPNDSALRLAYRALAAILLLIARLRHH